MTQTGGERLISADVCGEMLKGLLPITATITVTTLEDGGVCIIIGEKSKEKKEQPNNEPLNREA
jgi:hypothetical protein